MSNLSLKIATCHRSLWPMGFRAQIVGVLMALIGGVSPIGHTQDAESMRTRYIELQEQLRNNPFHRPIHLASRESSRTLEGEIYAVIAQPFGTIGSTLSSAANWCDILILHLNVKGCAVNASSSGDVVSMNIGRKNDQSIEDAYRLDFLFAEANAIEDYVHVMLNADKGPLGTGNYRINVEATELDASSSFVHFSYSYDYGLASRVALNSYLATAGRNKVGFTVVGRKPDGRPEYTKKMRGVVERNAMRYYLAVEAYLAALSVPERERVEKRLQIWHASVERYPLQLHELELDEYLAMKRKEIRRQQETP